MSEESKTQQLPTYRPSLGPTAMAFISRSNVTHLGCALCDAEARPRQQFEFGQAAIFHSAFTVADLDGEIISRLELVAEPDVDGQETARVTAWRDESAAVQVRCDMPPQRLEFVHRLNIQLPPRRYALRHTLRYIPSAGWPSLAGHAPGETPIDEPIWYVEVAQPLDVSAPPRPAATRRVSEEPPPILHITHQKAGSQWIKDAFSDLFGPRMAEPQPGNGHVSHWPVEAGKVYPTVYLSRGEVAALHPPADTKMFFVLRDLRDTLVSMYFSFRNSHPTITDSMLRLQTKLQAMEYEEGMIHLMDTWLMRVAGIQLSWLDAGIPIIRYADLLRSPGELLYGVLKDHCGLKITLAEIQTAMARHSFQQRSGRSLGQEDPHCHMRKGTPGDWRNRFTANITEQFKRRFAGVLIATGYEKDASWSAETNA